MSDQIEKFLDEEWRHESWEYLNDVPYCSCGQKLPGSRNPVRELERHRVRAALAAAGVAPQPEPEYEYGNQVMFNTHTPIMPAPDRETAMKRAWLQPAFRRVKAGAWEPAPTQEGEPS